MTTVNFHLEISPGSGHSYPIGARAPGGEATATMRLPLPLDELDHRLGAIRDAVLASAAVPYGAPDAGEGPVRQLGQWLFEALITDDVRSLYTDSSYRARAQGSVLRLVLRVRPPELARLPWEFLFDPLGPGYLGLHVPLVRYPEVLVPRQPLQVAAPLRILGMVARPHDPNTNGQHTLKIDDEQRRLRAALVGLERDGVVELSWVAGQTYGDLEHALSLGPWHVFHFIGHGGYDRDADEGALALADDAGRPQLIRAADLSRLLTAHHTLRLVMLSSCNNGFGNNGLCDIGRSSTSDAFSSVAGTLVRRWLPAVVAMQCDITDQATIVFSQTFYKNVAKGLPADTSVVRARQALRLVKRETLEWGTPRLYLRAPDEHIFDITMKSPAHPGHSPEEENTQDTEALYDEALTAYWSERWDQAVGLLQQVLAHRPQHPEAAAKLEQARYRQQLAIRYAEACAAADAQDWEEAIAGFMLVADADPTFRDVGDRLQDSRHQQQITTLHTEAHRLHRAGQWAAVVKIGERLQTLDPETADPDGLVTSARAELAPAAQPEQLAAQYHSGLRLLDAGQWQQAVDVLATLDPCYRDTAALLAKARQELSDPPSPPVDSPHVAIHPQLAQTVQHDKAVNAVVFSPDGHRLATASHDETARIWDADSGQEHLSVRHKGTRSNVRGRGVNVRGRAVQGVAFSPDGRQLATAGDDYTVWIWDAITGRKLTTASHNDVVKAVAFSPDGQRLATASDDHTARIWDATSAKRLVTVIHDDQVYGVAFSPDGQRLATVSNDCTARIWDADDGAQLTTLTHDKAALGVAFSPDGRQLATASDDCTARIWDADSGAELTTLTHDDRVWAVTFSPDGRQLATASDDCTARIWDADSGAELTTLTHDDQVYGVAFSPDGHRLATASRDKAVRTWSLLQDSDDE